MGFSYPEIGEIFHVSRARIHQIVKDYHSFTYNNDYFTKKLGQLIYERDDKECQLCVKCDGEKNRSKLCIHHIDEDCNNNTADNLVLLCRSCHSYLHGLSEYK